MQGVHRAVTGYLSRHSQEHAGAVLCVEQSTVSRHQSAVIDGATTHAQRWNAGHLAAMLHDDPAVLAELASMRAAARSADTLSTLSALLAAAQETTAAVSPAGPGGQTLTRAEREHLVETYLHLSGALLSAVHQLRGRP